MVKEPNESVDDRIEFSECNLPVSRPLTPSVTTSFHTAADNLCSSFCSHPVLAYQFVFVVPLLKHSSMISCLLHPSSTLCLLGIYVSRRPWRPMVFSAILQPPRNPFTYDGGESNPKNDTPLLLESRRGKLSAQVASQVPLCHKNGPDDGCCK